MSKPDELLHFTSNENYSIGVEIEFQVISKKTMDLVPLAPVLLENSPALLAPRITHEFIKSILELQTEICRNVRDVENDLMQTISMAEELAEENDCLLYASSLHPFAKHTDQVITDNERYQKIMEELQILGRRFISQGLHVHIGVRDGDTAIRVCNILQLYLPLLLSLSTSSPFSNGQDTGLLSYRTKLFEVLPLAGMYSYFTDWQHFNKEVEILKSFGVIQSLRDLWWDARPSPEFGTIEVRVCDLPGRFSDILAIVAFIQALVAYIAEERLHQEQPDMLILRANKWQAVRHGLDGFFIDESEHLSKERIPIRNAIELLHSKIMNYAEQLNGVEYLNEIQRILLCGTSAMHQKEVYEETGNLQKVISQLHQEFWQ